jgi:hypothetical protein
MRLAEMVVAIAIGTALNCATQRAYDVAGVA